MSASPLVGKPPTSFLTSFSRSLRSLHANVAGLPTTASIGQKSDTDPAVAFLPSILPIEAMTPGSRDTAGTVIAGSQPDTVVTRSQGMSIENLPDKVEGVPLVPLTVRAVAGMTDTQGRTAANEARLKTAGEDNTVLLQMSHAVTTAAKAETIGMGIVAEATMLKAATFITLRLRRPQTMPTS